MMKLFLEVSGTIFGLITIAHILRIIAEGSYLLRDPWYMLLTLIAAGLSAWAWVLLWRKKEKSG